MVSAVLAVFAATFAAASSFCFATRFFSSASAFAFAAVSAAFFAFLASAATWASFSAAAFADALAACIYKKMVTKKTSRKEHACVSCDATPIYLKCIRLLASRLCHEIGKAVKGGRKVREKVNTGPALKLAPLLLRIFSSQT
jgi:ribosomal protein S26